MLRSIPPQLIPLPRTPSVSTLLASYASSQGVSASNGSGAGTTRSSSLTAEVIAGLKLYFDKSLGNNLLYRFERGQYGEMKKRFGRSAEDGGEGQEPKEMSDFYGVEHLIRLFGRSCFPRNGHINQSNQLIAHGGSSIRSQPPRVDSAHKHGRRDHHCPSRGFARHPTVSRYGCQPSVPLHAE